MINKVNKSEEIEKIVDELLTRGVKDVLVKESLKKKLLSGKQLRVKFGIDPTSPDLHIGHAVVLRKLRAFQGLGHKAVLIIGDYTATIGDPSGKSKTRPPLDPETIKKNMSDYVKEAGLIIDIKNTEIRYNSEWLKKLTFAEIFKLASFVSVNNILERNDFANRLKNNESLRMHELFYPLMVAYDSVEVKADVELGGNDQLFNLLEGRTLMQALGLPPQDVLTTSLLVGLEGKEKMSKSLNNYIGIKDSPDEMFGKIMSIKDDLIEEYLILTTNVPTEKIKEMISQIQNGGNPRDIKIILAYENVKMYRGEKEGELAKENFINTFSKRDIPKDIQEINCGADELLSEVLLKAGLVESKGDFGRLVKEGAITNIETKEKVGDIFQKVGKGGVFKIGKHRFIKLRREEA